MSNAQRENKRGALTPARIASLKPRIDEETGKKLPSHAYDAISKAAVPGLLVRCQTSGKKYFYYQFRRPAFVKNRKTGEEVLNKNASTRICLGLSEDITIATARERARTVRDAAKAAIRAGPTGGNVTRKVHEAINNLDTSVEELEARQEAKRICPTAEEFIDTDYARYKRTRKKLKSFQDGREIQRLKYVLAVLSQPPKKGPDAGKKGDPKLNLLTKKLDEIDSRLIENWTMARQQRASDRTGKPPSDISVSRELMMMRSMFKLAIRRNYIKVNPLDGNALKAESEREVQPLTEKQVQRLQQVLIGREGRLRKQRKAVNEFALKEGGRLRREIPDDAYADFLRPVVLLALHTGLRFGELAGLQWENVKLRGSKASPDHSKLIIPNPKNNKKHIAPLNEFAEEILRKWRRDRSTIDPNAYVFSDRKGNKLVDIRRFWAPVFLEAGLPRGYRFHDLRHEYASKLAKKGATLIELQKLLNHSSPKMVQRYVDFHPDWMKETVGKLTEDDEWIV